jgi:hypothetical protein
MNTGKDLARAIRKRGRQRLRGSRLLWKDYKKMRGSRLRRGLNHLRFLVYFYPLLILGVVSQRHGPDLPLLLLTLYSAATILTRATQHSSALYRSGDLAFFMHLPVPDAQFFDYEARKFFRSSLAVWFFAFVAFAYVSFVALKGTMFWVVPLAGATLQWLLVVSLVLLLEWMAPAWVAIKVGIPLYVVAFAVLFVPADWIGALKNAAIPLPTAWVPYIFEQGLLRGQSASLLFLFPVIAIVAALPLSLRRLRQTYPHSAIVYPLMTGSVTVDNEDLDCRDQVQWPEVAETVGEQREVHARFRPSPIQLPAIDWNSLGWIERIAACWLGPVRRRHAEFLCADQMSWSGQWQVGLKIAGAGALLLVIWKDVPIWIPWTVGVIAGMVLLPLAGGTWPGMQPRPAGGTHVMPVYATVPLSFTQISRVLATVNLLRFLVVLPLLLAYGSLLGWRAQMPFGDSLWMAARVFIFLLSLQPFAIFLRHSEGTNDTRSLKLHTFAAVLVLLALVVAYLACAIGFFLISAWAPPQESALIGVGSVIGMFLFSVLSWLLYRRVFNRGRIDLLRGANPY